MKFLMWLKTGKCYFDKVVKRMLLKSSLNVIPAKMKWVGISYKFRSNSGLLAKCH